MTFFQTHIEKTEAEIAAAQKRNELFADKTFVAKQEELQALIEADDSRNNTIIETKQEELKILTDTLLQDVELKARETTVETLKAQIEPRQSDIVQAFTYTVDQAIEAALQGERALSLLTDEGIEKNNAAELDAAMKEYFTTQQSKKSTKKHYPTLVNCLKRLADVAAVVGGTDRESVLAEALK